MSRYNNRSIIYSVAISEYRNTEMAVFKKTIIFYMAFTSIKDIYVPIDVKAYIKVFFFQSLCLEIHHPIPTN